MIDDIKAIATVRDTARLCGFSAARFYELQKAGIMPPPTLNVVTHRPYYTEEQQRQCLEVRQKNRGINGQPVLFYARRLAAPPTPRSPSSRKQTTARRNAEHAGLVAALRSLGLTTATTALVTASVKAIFPAGIGETPEPELIRAVFLHLRRKDRDDSVGG